VSKYQQFVVTSCGELSTVVDITTGRPVTGAQPEVLATEQADTLNIAAGKGVKALAKALGCDDVREDEDDGV
jgi:hypothetical protein